MKRTFIYYIVVIIIVIGLFYFVPNLIFNKPINVIGDDGLNTKDSLVRYVLEFPFTNQIMGIIVKYTGFKIPENWFLMATSETIFNDVIKIIVIGLFSVPVSQVLRLLFLTKSDIKDNILGIKDSIFRFIILLFSYFISLYWAISVTDFLMDIIDNFLMQYIYTASSSLQRFLFPFSKTIILVAFLFLVIFIIKIISGGEITIKKVFFSTLLDKIIKPALSTLLVEAILIYIYLAMYNPITTNILIVIGIFLLLFIMVEIIIKLLNSMVLASNM